MGPAQPSDSSGAALPLFVFTDVALAPRSPPGSQPRSAVIGPWPSTTSSAETTAVSV